MTVPMWPWADSHLSSDWLWLRKVSTSATLAKGKDRSGSAKLNRSDKCIIGVFSLGKGAGAGDLYEQIIWAANPPRV